MWRKSLGVYCLGISGLSGRGESRVLVWISGWAGELPRLQLFRFKPLLPSGFARPGRGLPRSCRRCGGGAPLASWLQYCGHCRVARVAALRRQLAAVRIQRCFRAHRRRQKARRAMSMAAPEGGAAQGTPASRLGRSGQQATDRSISKHAAASAARSAPGNPAVSVPKPQPPSTQAMQRSAVVIQARWLRPPRP